MTATLVDAILSRHPQLWETAVDLYLPANAVVHHQCAACRGEVPHSHTRKRKLGSGFTPSAIRWECECAVLTRHVAISCLSRVLRRSTVIRYAFPSEAPAPQLCGAVVKQWQLGAAAPALTKAHLGGDNQWYASIIDTHRMLSEFYYERVPIDVLYSHLFFLLARATEAQDAVVLAKIAAAWTQLRLHDFFLSRSHWPYAVVVSMLLQHALMDESSAEIAPEDHIESIDALLGNTVAHLLMMVAIAAADLDLLQRCTMGFEQYGERTAAYTVLQIMCAIPPATLFSAETTDEAIAAMVDWFLWPPKVGDAIDLLMVMGIITHLQRHHKSEDSRLVPPLRRFLRTHRRTKMMRLLVIADGGQAHLHSTPLSTIMGPPDDDDDNSGATKDGGPITESDAHAMAHCQERSPLINDAIHVYLENKSKQV